MYPQYFLTIICALWFSNATTASHAQTYRFDFGFSKAQNYHIMTPPTEGKSWTMVWGLLYQLRREYPIEERSFGNNPSR